jgi:hypothetical protein
LRKKAWLRDAAKKQRRGASPGRIDDSGGADQHQKAAGNAENRRR